MLDKILSTKTSEIIKLLTDIFISIVGIGRSDGKNYLYFPNKQSPLLYQAHFDTKLDEKDYNKYSLVRYRGDVVVSAKDSVMGADDRAGVFALWSIAKSLLENKLPIPSLLFTNGEEDGGKGMKQFVKNYLASEFDHINLAIAFDRRHCNDYVSYVSNPDEVESYIEGFGFVSEFGSYSDIKDFSEHTLIPSVNVSVGYYNEHTVKEELHLDELKMTMRRAVGIVKDPIDKRYPCKAKTWGYSGGYGYEGWNNGWKNGVDQKWDYLTKTWVDVVKSGEEQQGALLNSDDGQEASGVGIQQHFNGLGRKKRNKFKLRCEACKTKKDVSLRYCYDTQDYVAVCGNCAKRFNVTMRSF